MVVFINLLFTGFFQYIPEMQFWINLPKSFPWLPALSFMRWAYEALILNELEGNTKLANIENYENRIGFTFKSSECCLIIFIFIAFYLLTLIIALVKLNFEKR